jgi:branched-chain amino acid aminotransferase
MAQHTSEHLWLGGGLVPWSQATVHASALGRTTVSSVYEGIRGYWSAPRGQLYLFRLDDHMRRFMESVKMVRMQCPYDRPQLTEAVLELLRANGAREDFYASPLIFERALVRSFTYTDPGEPADVLIDSWPSPSGLPAPRGLHACVSSWTRLSDTSSPNRIKCVSNYHNGRLAAIEARQDGYDVPLILNDRGRVAEAPGACLFLVRRGRLVTPSVSSDILESITRESIITFCREQLGLTTEERDVDRTELYVADELFLCGTWWEVAPVLSVDRLPVGDGAVGPVTGAIARAYEAIVRGENAAYREWLTPVWDEGARDAG